MGRATTLVLVTIALLGSVWAVADRLGPPTPVTLRFEPQSLDWGQALSGDRVECTLRLQNGTPDAIAIVEIKKSCSCQSVQAPDRIEAGSWADIQVVVDTSNKSGTLKGRVTFLTDNPEFPKLSATVTGLVTPFCEVDPQPFIISRVPTTEYVTEIRVMPATNVGFVDLSCVLDTAVPVELAVVEDAPGYRITVSGRMPVETHHFKIPLRVTTEDGLVRVHDVNASLKVLPRIVCTPKHAVVFNLRNQANGHRTRTIELRASRDDIDFDVRSARCIGDYAGAFDVQVRTVNKGRVYEVVLDLVKEPAARSFRDRLVIQFDDNGEQEIQMPVLARLAARNTAHASGRSEEGQGQ